MSIKIGFLFITLLTGSFAHDDMSIFYDHTDTSSRIVGGEPAGLVPYVVALTYGANVRNLLCGASLVTTSYVLTAAHCIYPVRSSNGELLQSLRGQVGTDRYASGGTTYSFSRGIMHPDYNRRMIKNDIGLFMTSSEVELTDTVSLVALTFRFIEAGANTSVTGWGRTRAGGTVSEELLQLNATVVDGEECVYLVRKRADELRQNIPPVDPALEICTYTQQRTGTCNGDSGSPLMDRDTGEQIGVVSWGIPCALEAPDMFARISRYRDWILATVPDLNN